MKVFPIIGEYKVALIIQSEPI